VYAGVYNGVYGFLIYRQVNLKRMVLEQMLWSMLRKWLRLSV